MAHFVYPPEVTLVIQSLPYKLHLLHHTALRLHLIKSTDCLMCTLLLFLAFREAPRETNKSGISVTVRRSQSQIWSQAKGTAVRQREMKTVDWKGEGTQIRHQQNSEKQFYHVDDLGKCFLAISITFIIIICFNLNSMATQTLKLRKYNYEFNAIYINTTRLVQTLLCRLNHDTRKRSLCRFVPTQILNPRLPSLTLSLSLAPMMPGKKGHQCALLIGPERKAPLVFIGYLERKKVTYFSLLFTFSPFPQS